jgi:non-heme chloroperoxidase
MSARTLARAALLVCPLIGASGSARAQPRGSAAGSVPGSAAGWTDPSPHEVRFVDVAPGVRLEVLDWGGTGRDVVLLTGSGHSAHVYDEFALELKDCCHVYGITRRGYGASSIPETGYDEPSLSNDVWTVIQALGLKAPVLIGHSMAGAELAGVGMLHSDALGGLVYLDAIGDSTDDPPDDPTWKALQAKLPPSGTPRVCTEDRSTFTAFQAYFQCRHGIAVPEGELRQHWLTLPDGSVGDYKTPGWVSRAIGTGRPPRDYSKIKVPVLAISDAVDFDLSHLKPEQPQPRNDEERAVIIALGKATQAVFDRWSANLKRGVPGARVVEMPGATHYLWMTREADVLREIHAFIAAQPALAGTDPSPHKVRFVTVAPDVQLEVLDWGGTGREVVLLTGSGHSAHVYDEFAPMLKDCCHVYGITRRGYGASSTPASGYSERRLAQDVVQVLDTLGIGGAVLVGHSMAGEELTRIGIDHADHASGLVYLDAAADLTDFPASSPAYRELFRALPARMQGPPPPAPSDMTSPKAFNAWRVGHHEMALPESDLLNTFVTSPTGALLRFKTSREVHEAIGAGAVKPDYASVKLPVLALFATRCSPPADTADYACVGRASTPPDQEPRDAQERAAIKAFEDATDAYTNRWKASLRRAPAGVRIVDLSGANHYVFLSNESDVVNEIRRFVAHVPTPR